ncbi:aminotransferase [Schizosaccharomyces japonicus yFS275]|uniref:Aminotransferase n=1 Tax=Schizosaccharomyces japonicus (strain yFS275 / FY16936) TaxID=402676 RepID=B6K7G7_SCHJY|nr:aminotransferase [Schizosaccharomyces japonicus yFS275]EEB09471.1 aminotransferase [Schizosaccharomyces japonicus yFS275]
MSSLDIIRNKSQGVINLFKGHPFKDLLPNDMISRAVDKVLHSTRYGSVMQYGLDEGDPDLRCSVAKWLAAFYKDTTTKDNIVISGGASQNLACILQRFTDPIFTRKVFMVAPTYFLACKIFEDSGFQGRLKGVPENDEGLDLTFLEKCIQEEEQHAKKGSAPNEHPYKFDGYKLYRYIIYVVPSFGNPSARVMSLVCREQLVKLARKYDALVIADDVYDMLNWTNAEPLPRLVTIDRNMKGQSAFGNTVSNGSFSKILCPGIRTGWAEGTPDFVFSLSQTGSTKSGGCASQLLAGCIEPIVSSGDLTKWIQGVLVPALSARQNAMEQAIIKYLVPLNIKYSSNKGGYFAWLEFPEFVNTDDFHKTLLTKYDVVIAPGSAFHVTKDTSFTATNCARLSFSWETPDNITKGIRLISDAFKTEYGQRN